MKDSVFLQRTLPKPLRAVAVFTMLGTAALLTGVPAASAQLDIPLTYIDKAGNANDTTGYGAVGYNYYIGTSEVTNRQYAAFLNSVAKSAPYGLYSTGMSAGYGGGITRSGSSGSYIYTVKDGYDLKPVTHVSFFDAARFCNWLTNGATDGSDTETGMYTLADGGIGMIRNAEKWTAGGYAITSENEWHKAAYYNLTTESYTLYATGDNVDTSMANYANSVGNTTAAGSYPAEQNGTVDMMGNVWEWNEGITDGTYRGTRGGVFYATDYALSSWGYNNETPSFEYYYLGFRISTLGAVPEPSTYAALIGATMLSVTLLSRRKAQSEKRSD